MIESRMERKRDGKKIEKPERHGGDATVDQHTDYRIPEEDETKGRKYI